MLWYKSWLDTRWRFLIGLAVLLVSACGILMTYGQVQRLLPTIGAMNVPDGPFTEAIEEAVRIQRTYRGFVWSQWFDKNLTSLATLFAALLGSGSSLAGPGRGVLFSLALPVTRRRWVGSRAAVGLAELFVLVLVPSLAIPLLSPLAGEQYALSAALAHAACAFVAASVFFGLASLLSTVFNDVWRPVLLTCLAALGLAIGETFIPNVYGPFEVMSGESYFYDGSLPWGGLLVSVLLTAALLYAAAAQVVRRDF